MPIIRERYPENWGAIATQVKYEANWRCEDCQRPCRQPREPLSDCLKRIQVWRQAHSSPPADTGLQLSLLPRQIALFSLPYQGDAPKESPPSRNSQGT